jgi:hypothetical protein
MLMTFLVFSAFFSSFAQAAPGIPHVFFGSVFVNDQPAPDGTLVEARINGVTFANTTTHNGMYGYGYNNRPGTFYVEDTDSSMEGSVVKLFVDGIDTGKSEIFCNGCLNSCDTHIVNCETFDISVTSSGITAYFLRLTTFDWVLATALVTFIVLIAVALKMRKPKRRYARSKR